MPKASSPPGAAMVGPGALWLAARVLVQPHAVAASGLGLVKGMIGKAQVQLQRVVRVPLGDGRHPNAAGHTNHIVALQNNLQLAQLIANALGQTLGQERERAQQRGGLGGGLLGSLLDQDGDGQLGMGDLIKVGGSLFGGRR